MDREVDKYVEQIREFMRGDLPRLDAVVGRGGFLNRENQRIKGGVYQVCSVEDGTVREEEDIIKAVRDHAEMDHASNLGNPVSSWRTSAVGSPWRRCATARSWTTWRWRRWWRERWRCYVARWSRGGISCGWGERCYSTASAKPARMRDMEVAPGSA